MSTEPHVSTAALEIHNTHDVSEYFGVTHMNLLTQKILMSSREFFSIPSHHSPHVGSSMPARTWSNNTHSHHPAHITHHTQSTNNFQGEYVQFDCCVGRWLLCWLLWSLAHNGSRRVDRQLVDGARDSLDCCRVAPRRLAGPAGLPELIGGPLSSYTL